jgi:hypothetical protein
MNNIKEGTSLDDAFEVNLRSTGFSNMRNR